MRLALTVYSILLMGMVVTAEGQVPEPPGTVSGRLFPRVTGVNGFEELVLAGEVAKACKPLDAAVSPGATLSQKRKALADPSAVRALRLMRAGLDKPLLAPRDANGEAPLDMYGPLRQLARLTSVEMYVKLADGRVGEALDSLRSGLRLGYAVQSDLTIGGLVGIAIDMLSLKGIQDHVGQLSERDCRQLEALAREWMDLPDPAIRVLQTEREYVLKRLRDQLQGNNALFDQVGSLLAARLDAITASLRLPAWKRNPLPDLGDSQAEMFVKALGLEQVYGQAQKAFTRDQAAVQILGVHAAIRRYLWEYDRLPGDLDSLKLGRLGLDPFTGNPLRYTRLTDRTYDLVCEGLEESKKS